jgi:hypothetical protein
MRLVVLIGLMASFGAVMLFALLRLVRELIEEDFFQAPSMPGDTANPIHDMSRDNSSPSANMTS